MKKTESKIDLAHISHSYYEAGVKNGDIANTMLVQIYAATFALCFAEIALIGSTELQSDAPHIFAVVAAVLLVISIFLLLSSMHQNWNNASAASKLHFELADMADEYMEGGAIEKIDKLPKNMKRHLDMINILVSRNPGHSLVKWALGFLVVATILTILLYAGKIL